MTHYLFFPFIFISLRLITLQYCSGFCHALTWISHGFTCVPRLFTHCCIWFSNMWLRNFAIMFLNKMDPYFVLNIVLV